VNKEPENKLGSTLPLALSYDSIRHGRQRISLLIYHQSGTQVATMAEGQRLTIGRDPNVELTIDDQGLSRKHACFQVTDGEVWVEDLQSTNGTQLNGEQITRARMSVGDEATMGGVSASIHVLLPTDVHKYGLDSHDQFLSLLEHEVERGRTFGRTVALLMLRPAAGGEDMVGNAPSLLERLRTVDRLALYSDDTAEILLPEVNLEAALQLARSLIASADQALLCSVAIYPDSGIYADTLLDSCRAALRQASEEEPVQIAAAEAKRWSEQRAAPSVGDDGLVIRSPAMHEVYDTIQRLANSVIPVLLNGETGTGKEVLARLIHEGGARAGKRMASINCGAIPATLVESVLFGHEKGAFTGATQSSKGIFEEADGGTVLLDEVGELSASAQAALLRVLESKQITRVGSTKEIAVDVRIIAATNRDLEAMCQQETFRWDLYYRLNAMTLRVPPLRERPEEIAPLAELFMRQANVANGCTIAGIDADAMRMLHQYPWPGNVRELRNAIERAVVIARGDHVTQADLPQRVREGVRLTEPTPTPAFQTGASAQPGAMVRTPTPTQPVQPVTGDTLDFKVQMQRHEAQLILDALRRCDWNRTEASQLLNMPVRTLSHKINQHGIKRLGYGLEDAEGD